jgi:hypothetical protein
MSFFKRLFGKKEKIALKLPPEFLQAEPPDWLLELKVNSTPQSTGFDARIQLLAETRTGSATLEVQSTVKNGEPQTATADLTPIEAGRLLVLLGFSFPNDIGNVGALAADGVPATLAVHRREPYQLREGSFNLTNWLDSKKSQPPTVEIALVLMAVKQRVFPGN